MVAMALDTEAHSTFTYRQYPEEQRNIQLLLWMKTDYNMATAEYDKWWTVVCNKWLLIMLRDFKHVEKFRVLNPENFQYEDVASI
jgi:hypothetical protein